MGVDRHDLNGKLRAPDAHFGCVVVGAGQAGIAAAHAAAAQGKTVLLIDEHPVPPSQMGNDTPYYFGGRMTGATQNSARMVEQLFMTNPALEAAFDAGIDVRLGTYAWGLFRNGPGVQTLPAPMLGIGDQERATMIGFDELVLATGARDVILGFPGWTQPGVMGAMGFHALVARYAAFDGEHILIIGTGPQAAATAALAQAHGVHVAGFVECADAPESPTETLMAAAGAPVPLYLRCAIATVTSGLNGVAGVTLAKLDGGARTDIACDTIVMAIDIAPATELLSASDIATDGTIRLVGDAAGPAPDPARLARWADALGRFAPADTIVCQCEEVTRADLLGVQPPNYLHRPPRMAARGLTDLLADGPAHPDQIKRLTRAGMGVCQGRRCRETVACLLAQSSGIPPNLVPRASHRPPVRPVPLHILADWQEDAAMVAGWDVWFGIPTQWTPYALIGTPEEAEHVSIVGGYSHV